MLKSYMLAFLSQNIQYGLCIGYFCGSDLLLQVIHGVLLFVHDVLRSALPVLQILILI